MNKTKRLSIILPTYKVEAWIEKCIRSLENQDIPKNDYEIIVVNDGSPDRSGAIARELSAEYNNIVVIDQENQGVSAARNTGIKAAKGKYLLFVDPDDTIEKKNLGSLLSFAEGNELQVAMFSQRVITFEGKEVIYCNGYDQTPIMSGIELFDHRLTDSICKYLFSTAFIKKNGLLFLQEASFVEDGEFIARVMSLAERTAFKKITFYNYFMREGSAVNSQKALTEKGISGAFASSINLLSFRKEIKLTDNGKIFLNQSIAKFAVMPFFIAAGLKGIKMLPAIKQQLKQSGIKKLGTSGLKKMRKRHAILFNTSLNLLFGYLLLTNFWRSIQIRLGLKSAR